MGTQLLSLDFRTLFAVWAAGKVEKEAEKSRRSNSIDLAEWQIFKSMAVGSSAPQAALLLKKANNDMATLLSVGNTQRWPWRVFLLGHEFKQAVP